jgi:hypothetical protein
LLAIVVVVGACNDIFYVTHLFALVSTTTSEQWIRGRRCVYLCKPISLPPAWE